MPLLAWAAYRAPLPWIDCLRAFPAVAPIGDSRYCMFGVPAFSFHGVGWNLVGGAIYAAAALWFLRRR